MDFGIENPVLMFKILIEILKFFLVLNSKDRPLYWNLM